MGFNGPKMVWEGRELGLGIQEWKVAPQSAKNNEESENVTRF